MNFFPTPVNVDILNSSHKSQTFLMASRMVNCFQKVFKTDFAQIHEGIIIYGNKTAPWSMGCRTKMCLVQSLSPVQLFVTPWTSPSPRACSISHPLTWWCHPTISSSVIPFSYSLQSVPASGSFPVSQFFKLGGQSIGVSVSASVLPLDIQDWFPLGWISLRSKGLSRVFSNTTHQKHQFFGAQLSSQSNSHIHTWLLEKPKLWLDRSLLAK